MQIAQNDSQLIVEIVGDTAGQLSWELDALDPRVIESLIEAKVEQYRDPIAWQAMVERERAIQSELSVVQQQLEQRGI